MASGDKNQNKREFSDGDGRRKRNEAEPSRLTLVSESGD